MTKDKGSKDFPNRENNTEKLIENRFIIAERNFLKYLVPAREAIKNTSPFPKFDVQMMETEIGKPFRASTAMGHNGQLRQGEVGIMIESPHPKYVRAFWDQADELAKPDGATVIRY